jgi:hypothetical protein
LTIAEPDVTRKTKTNPTGARTPADRRRGPDRREDERRKLPDRRQSRPGFEGIGGRRQGVDRRKGKRRDAPEE